MFTEMRKGDRQISDNQAEAILNNGDYGVLAVNGTGGYPYAVPLNYVYMNKSIFFHCAKEGFKIDCIEKDCSVSFCVVGKSEIISSKFTTDYSSVIVFGSALEAHDEEKKQSLQALIKKYSKDYIKEGYEYIEKAIDDVKVVKISIAHLTGKSRN
jgi:nitroimidazol reductase NimA-like FMN-containing flavoprotein (pyridoxamine 5'-phosphate oxidase superfamily)